MTLLVVGLYMTSRQQLLLVRLLVLTLSLPFALLFVLWNVTLCRWLTLCTSDGYLVVEKTQTLPLVPPALWVPCLGASLVWSRLSLMGGTTVLTRSRRTQSG